MSTPSDYARGIRRVELWQLAVPLAQPYHLSRQYGTLTHSHAAIVCITLNDGSQGWGEGDPGGVNFDGETIDSVMAQLGERLPALPGCDIEAVIQKDSAAGAAAAAMDVACHDALARSRNLPLHRLLGTQRRASIPSLWPTSSGSAADDLAIIGQRYADGFRTYMLKMGSRPITDEIRRLNELLPQLPADVRIMVDANQGWQPDEALTFSAQVATLPLVLIEQPVAANELATLGELCRRISIPISVDESLCSVSDAETIIATDAADVFSLKVSKHGGLGNSVQIARKARAAGRQCLMNSMIELGITQAASLQLGCTLDNLIDCGHAYMSTLRMADDITDFGTLVSHGTAGLPEATGLGVTVFREKLCRWQTGESHVYE